MRMTLRNEYNFFVNVLKSVTDTEKAEIKQKPNGLLIEVEHLENVMMVELWANIPLFFTKQSRR